MPMQIIDGASLSDLQRLSILQHQGAATGLLDFTEYLLVALWFACTELPDKDARVFVLDVGDPLITQNGRILEDPFNAGQFAVYYEPDRSLGARVVAQQSMFVICDTNVPDQYVQSVVVPRASKGPLREYLARLGLSQTALFADIPGLAEANTTHVPLQRPGPLTPEQHRNRGNRAYQAGRFGDALAAYESYAAAQPDVAQPYCLIGDTLAALGRFDDSEAAYTRAIENLDRPIFLGENVIPNRELFGNVMSRALFFNRGNVRAAAGDHRGAVADFDTALQHGGGSNREILYNRGNSKFALGMFTEAHEDFEAVWLERDGSDAALAMANCKVMLGEFGAAYQGYLDGGAAPATGSAAHCQENAEQVRRILECLNGHDFRIRREGPIVFVETANIRDRPTPFPFAGNQGNSGNIPSGMVTAPGGKGYAGAKGFSVILVSPNSPPRD